MKVLLFILTIFFSITVFGQKSSTFFVKSTPNATLTHLASNPLVKSFESPFINKVLQDVYVLELNQESSIETVKSLLVDIEYSLLEIAPEVKLFWTPNDYSNNSYHLDLIQAEAAWEIDNDASDVLIGIIDDAVDINHPDLANNIWYNSLETPGNNIDDDGNGFIDDYVGWDFADGDNDAAPYDGLVNLTHGTHVSGIAAGVTHNAEGISSISANARVLPIKIGQSSTGGLSNTIQAIDYAIAMGVDVINMSWGGALYSQVYQDLFNAAAEEGIICVASAGNSSSSLPMYPASYENVISVASTDQNDEKSGFSNFGATVDIAAPGSDIMSSVYGLPGDYQSMSGTSMSGPLTAGLIALMKSAQPLASAEEIEYCLLYSADPVNGSFQNDVGAGRINALAALQCITELNAEFNSDFTQICVGNEIQFFNYSYGNSLTYEWTFEGGVPATSSEQFPLIEYPSEGVYSVSLQITDGFDSDFESVNGYITVSPPSAVISGNSQVFSGGYGSVILNLEGNPPFSITLFDGSNSYSYSGIMDYDFSEIFQVNSTTEFEITNFSDSQCSGNFSGLATIEVISSEDLICEGSESSFMKYLGTEVDDLAHGICYLPNHGYLILGRKTLGPSNFRNYIALVNECGVLLWEKLYNTNEYGIARTAHLVGDEIKVVGYDGGPPTNQTYLMTLDLSGNILNVKSFGGGTADYPRESSIDSNGDILIGGVTNSSGTFGGNDMYVVKSTPAGDLLWSRRIGGQNNEFLHGLQVDSNDDILAVGKYESYTPGVTSGAAIKLNSAGDLLWSKIIDTGSGTVNFGSSRTINDFYYITGFTNQNTFGQNDALLVKLDLEGNTIWSKIIGGNGTEFLADIIFNGENLVLLGSTNSDLPNSDLFLMEITEQGDLVETVTFGSTTDDIVSIAGNTLQYIENSMVGVATIQDNNLFGGDDMVLFKFPELDDICEVNTSSVSIQDATGINNVDFTLSINSPGFSYTDIIYTEEIVVSNQGFLCSSILPADSILPCDIDINVSYEINPCELDNVLFTVSNNLSSSLDYWAWDFGDGNQELGSSNLMNHFYQTPGLYSVELITGVLENGCLDTLNLQLEIIESSSACNLSYLPESSFCLNSEIYFSNLSSTDETAVSYEWTFEGPSTISSFTGETPPPISWSSPGIYEVSLDMSIDCGTLTNSILVTVFEPPSIALPEDISACETTEIVLLDTEISSWNYSWSPVELFEDPNSALQSIILSNSTTIYLDITDSWTGCSFSDSIQVTIEEANLSFYEDSLTFCDYSNLEVGYTSSHWQNVTFNWPISYQDENLISIAAYDSFDLIAELELDNCSAADTVHITINEQDTFSELSICYGESLVNQTSPLWVYNGNSSDLLMPQESGIYTWSETKECGVFIHTLNITVEECDCEVYIPNAFTPNFDRLNQLFGPETVCSFDNYFFQVFDRWGEVIFETTDPSQKWGGTYKRNMVQDGIYTWQLKYSTTTSQLNRELTGHVTIIR